MTTIQGRMMMIFLAALVLTGLAGASTAKKGEKAMKTAGAAVVRETVIDGHRVKIDMTAQVISLVIPEDRSFGETREKAEPPLSPTIAQAMGYGHFVSASVLAAKAKQFDDGLYAAADLAAQNGCGSYTGKKAMLVMIEQALRKEPATPQSRKARALIYAALTLGGQAAQDESAVVKEAGELQKEFLGSELRSKPIGFYTWNAELGKVFQSDRLLQQTLKTVPDAMPLASAIRKSGATAAYAGYMKLNGKLTNPLIKEVSDLRPLVDGASLLKGPFAMYPPSRAYETELVKKLYGNSPIPEGFNLMDKLIEGIRAGKISLRPGKDSGWYDYQTWALETLVLPDKAAEAPKLDLSDSYKKELVNLFKALLALTRETHIKQLEVPACGAGMPEPSIDISPDLTLEPLATYYLRRAESYAFVRKVLVDTFGPEGVMEMHRVTKNGPVRQSLVNELVDMERLFRGAHAIVAAEIGMPGATAKEAVPFTRAWMKGIAKDPDVGADNRMMVPVFYDLQRRKTKVWAVLGYDTKPLEIKFLDNPSVQVVASEGAKPAPRIQFRGQSEKLVYPVMAEVYVKKILNRDEFRKVCDRERTASRILAAIQK
jgi:hypothetical protein